MDLRSAVKKTLAYASYFNFPLSPDEVHRWLIFPHPVDHSSIAKHIPKLSQQDIKYKKSLVENTRQKEKTAQKFIALARFIPGIRLIALTGSVAANNSRKNDDLDLFIITQPYTLWLIRPVIIILLNTQFHRRHPRDNNLCQIDAFCPNLWLDTLSLALPESRRNIYTAHEVLQVKPLLDRGHTLNRFVQANAWSKSFLANAYQEASGQRQKKEKTFIVYLILAPINFIAFILQSIYMFPKKTVEKISLHSAFFHKNDPSIFLVKHLKHNSV